MGPLYRAYLRKKLGNGGPMGDYDWSGMQSDTAMLQDGSQGNYMGAAQTMQNSPMNDPTINSGVNGFGKGDYSAYADNGGGVKGFKGMQTQTSTSGKIGAAVVDAGITYGSQAIQKAAYKPDYKYQPDGTYRTVQGAKGISTGWKVGSQALGPIGGIVGAFIGGGIGIFQGNKMDKKEKERHAKDDAAYREMVGQEQQINSYMSQDYFNNTRNNQMYATGGPLMSSFMAKQATPGGSLSKLSEESTEVQGQTHEEGGVQLPSQGAEVEKGETISDGYVFSKELGFAKLHKPIAKSIGKIEEKPATAERITSLHLLKEKEKGLKLSQEFLKRQLNIQ